MPRRDLSPRRAEKRARLPADAIACGSATGAPSSGPPVSHSAMNDIIQGRTEVSATVAFRIAKMLDVSLHHVLTGTALPPGTCKHCGRPSAE